MDEETALPPRFINEYARTKFMAEELVRAYEGPFTILRPRAVFGPGDTVVFPRILRAARKGLFPIIEADEVVMADLIYIDVLISYIMRVIEDRVTGLLHLSNNRPVPVAAFLQDLFSKLHLPNPTRRLPVKKAMLLATAVEALYKLPVFQGEPPVTRFGVSVFAYSKTLDVSRCLQHLGPPSVPLSEAVDRFVDWQKG